MPPSDSHVPWRRMPLFVASTFRDMDRERDLLARVVIPQVNERLRERGHGVSIYPIDLRWGVETDDGLDADTRQRVVLQVCAGEVRRCRPLFLGLLGGEYGWVPPAHIGEEARVAAGVPDPGFPLSVTALEILSAVQEGRNDGAAPVLLARSGAARTRAQTRFRRHLQDLTVPYDEDTFTDTATAELLRLLDAVLVPPAPGDWLAAEVRAHRWAAEQEAQQFVGRDAELGWISDHWSGAHPSPTTLALVGPSGSGKSALMAMAATRMTFPGQARAYVRVGAATSKTVEMCVLVLLAQVDPATAQAIARRRTPADLTLDDVLEPWLAAVRGPVRQAGALIVVDGIDSFRGAMDESPSLAWFPLDLSDHARVLVSATDDSFQADLLRRRPATRVLDIGDLSTKQARALVVQRLEQHHKAVAPALVRRLVSRSTVARWLVVASDLLTTLVAHDYVVLRRAGRRTTDPGAALRLLLETVVDDLPSDVADLQLTALNRLIELVDPRLGAMLCVVGEAVFGVREDDLRAVVADATERAVSGVEMALFRDVLSAFVTVQDGLWTFVHDTVVDGVARLVDEEFRATGTDVGDFCRDLLIRRLLTYPISDVVRSRELLPLLLVAEETQLLTRLLADPEGSTDDSVRGFSAVLLGTVLGGEIDAVLEVVAAATTDSQRLTVIALLVAGVPMVKRDVAARIGAVCRAAIVDVSPTAADRFGHTAQDLTALMDRVVFDPFAPHATPDPVEAWLAAALHRGAGSLAEAPGTSGGVLDARSQLKIVPVSATVAEFAVAVAEGRVIAPPDDADLAASCLAQWRKSLIEVQWPDASAFRSTELQLKLTERAMSLAWPERGFTADDTDFAQARAWVDRTRGNPDLAVLLGTAARLRALACLRDELDDRASPVVRDALACLDEAIWELDVQWSLTPDARWVELILIECRLVHMRLLAGCDELVAARAAGLPALTAPHVVDVVGPLRFDEAAVLWLICWNEEPGDDDPRPVLDRLAAEADRRPAAPDDEHAQLVETLLLVVAVRAAGHLGHFDFAELIVERTARRLREGLIAEPEDGPFAEIVLEEIAEEAPRGRSPKAAAARRLRDLAERLR